MSYLTPWCALAVTKERDQVGITKQVPTRGQERSKMYIEVSEGRTRMDDGNYSIVVAWAMYELGAHSSI